MTSVLESAQKGGTCTPLRRILNTGRNVFHKDETDKELDTEVHAFPDLLSEEKIASGAPPAEARRLANLNSVEPSK